MKTYDTGKQKWIHGKPVDWINGQVSRSLLGPCPKCGAMTSTYGGGFSCHDHYCPCNASQFACNVGPVPSWWNSEIDVFLDGNSWCATGAGFVNLQESHAGFGDSPGAAVIDLLKA